MNLFSIHSLRPVARTGLLGAVLLGASVAQATPTFPGVIRTELGLSSTPQCSVCHQGAYQVGTVTTPFGAALRARGLEFHDDGSLSSALAALARESVDSDGDGTPDTEELKVGRDPNRKDAPGEPGEEPVVDFPPEPTYGCHAAPGAPLGALLAGWWLARRRRRA
ncbi:MAG: thrombospondin type 3 repeat-containing protein [Cystobacter sp.]